MRRLKLKFNAFSTQVEYGEFPGATVPFQNQLGFVRPTEEGTIPCYRVVRLYISLYTKKSTIPFFFFFLNLNM